MSIRGFTKNKTVCTVSWSLKTRCRTAGSSLANSELQQSVRESTGGTSSVVDFYSLKCDAKIEISD